MAENEATKSNPLIDRLFEAGAHFGYTRTRRHPSITPFIFGTKNRVEIFDLEETSKLLQQAAAFAKTLGQERKMILFVGGKQEARAVIREKAETLGMPYVAGRWIGGTLTNFEQTKKRVALLEELREKRGKGAFEKYTKRERLEFDRDIDRLEHMFGGLVPMKEQLPAAVFAVDVKREHSAVKEAKDCGLPVIALMSSDGAVGDATYPVVGNDSALKSISLFVDEIARAYQEGLQSSKAAKEAVEEHSAKASETSPARDNLREH